MISERGGARYRSILFAPYKRRDWLLEAGAVGADAVMCDLEDMVPVALKTEGREAVVALIDELREQPIGKLVRINGWGSGFVVADLHALVREGVDCIALPKAETAADVVALDRIITELEIERGLPVGRIEILPLAETAAGLHASYELVSASPRVLRFYGVANATREGDGARSLRLRVQRDGREWVPIGAQVLLSARAAGVTHLLGATPMEPDNDERTRELAELSRTYGANGCLCVHPRQIPIVNEIYSPTNDEVQHARRVVIEIHQALERGESSVVIDGETATYSHVRAALDTLTLARSDGMSFDDVPHIDVPAYSNRFRKG